jgi:predicted Fe-Mo cluster-binding NifX family protein
MEGDTMRIAVTAQGRDLSALVDPRFGRAKFFVVADTETGEFTATDNTQNLSAAQGAGIQAGRNAVELGVQAVITGHVGPKAFTTLQTGGAAVYTGASGTVADAIEQFKAGNLKQSAGADVEGHWV